MYGTTEMQLYTRVYQTLELKIVIREWNVMTRESPFAYSHVQNFMCA